MTTGISMVLGVNSGIGFWECLSIISDLGFFFSPSALAHLEEVASNAYSVTIQIK